MKEEKTEVRTLDISKFDIAFAKALSLKTKLYKLYEIYQAVEPDCQELAKQAENFVLDFIKLYENVKQRVGDAIEGKESRTVYSDEVIAVSQEVVKNMRAL